jgi:HK97 family phage major capsid protein
MQFDLKTARCLTAVPIELIQTSEPAIDRLLAELIGTAMGVAEDTAFFATSNTTNGPNSIYADYASLTNHTVGESANGGNLAYTDITRTLYKSAAANARGPLVWFMSPRTFWSRIVGLIDGTSRPIFVPFSEGLAAAVPGRLMGYPVYVTSVIPEDQTVGSGSSQSYLLLTNPTYLHIAEPPNGVELAVSSEFLFSSAQVAIRGIKRVSFGWSPKLGTTILRGIN